MPRAEDLSAAHCAPYGSTYLHTKLPTGSNNDCSAIRTSTIYFNSTSCVSSAYYIILYILEGARASTG